MIFRQNSMRTGFTIIYGSTSVIFLALSYVAAHQWKKNTGPSVLGFGVDLFMVFAVFAVLAIRAWKQSVSVANERITVRTITRTRTIEVHSIRTFGLFKNLLRNAWLGGIQTTDGKCIRFPFYAKSWIRDDPRNDRMKLFIAQIERAAKNSNSDSTSRLQTVNY